MVSRSSYRFMGEATAFLLILLALCFVPSALAQHGSEGTVTVTVLDATGSVVQGAALELQDLATNDLRKGETQDKGTHTFVNLSLGKYRLSVSKAGFKTQVFTDVVVQAAQDDRHLRRRSSRCHQRNRGGQRRDCAAGGNDDQRHWHHDRHEADRRPSTPEPRPGAVVAVDSRLHRRDRMAEHGMAFRPSTKETISTVSLAVRAG